MTRRFRLAITDPGRPHAQFFAELRHHLAPDVECVYFSIKPTPHSILQRCGVEVFPPTPALAGEADVSDEVLAEEMGPYARVSGWAQDPELLRRARRVYATADAFFARTRPDACLCKGPDGGVIRAAFSKYSPGPRIFVENGYLPVTTQMDTQGCNFYASITPMVAAGDFDVFPDADCDRLTDEKIEAFRQGVAWPTQRPKRVVRASLGAQLQRELRRMFDRSAWDLHQPAPLRNIPARLPDHFGRYVFLPLQVRKDSQLVLHSPLVGSDMDLLIRAAYQAVREVAPELKLVVKPHPEESGRYAHNLAALAAEFPDIQFVRDQPARELVAASSAVITVNSTVGFEAIVCDRPVVTLGENFYCFEPLVCPVQQLVDLPRRLAQALGTPPDTATRRRFLRFVGRTMLAHGSHKDFSDASFSAVANKIRQICGLPAVTGASVSNSAG